MAVCGAVHTCAARLVGGSTAGRQQQGWSASAGRRDSSGSKTKTTTGRPFVHAARAVCPGCPGLVQVHAPPFETCYCRVTSSGRHLSRVKGSAAAAMPVRWLYRPGSRQTYRLPTNKHATRAASTARPSARARAVPWYTRRACRSASSKSSSPPPLYQSSRRHRHRPRFCTSAVTTLRRQRATQSRASAIVLCLSRLCQRRTLCASASRRATGRRVSMRCSGTWMAWSRPST